MKIGEVELALPDYQASDQDVIRKKLTALLGSLEGTYPEWLFLIKLHLCTLWRWTV